MANTRPVRCKSSGFGTWMRSVPDFLASIHPGLTHAKNLSLIRQFLKKIPTVRKNNYLDEAAKIQTDQNPKAMRFSYIALIIFCFGFTPHPDEQWIDLFNGQDLTGWDKWLATPDSSYQIPGMARDATGNYSTPLGLNNDPLGVFGVTNLDGSAVIHISGQGFGALTTRDEYENFHLSVEYKWGERKWAPRDNQKRDSGILYYCIGPHGAASGAWMQSQECQVQEGDTGDYWSVAGGIADVRSREIQHQGKQMLRYDPASPRKTIGYGFDGKNWDILRCLKASDQEKPNSEWNHVEVYALNGTSIHVVNGTTVMILENSRRLVEGREVPLTKGKIQIQTEGAEIYYRAIRIRPIRQLPPTLDRKP